MMRLSGKTPSAADKESRRTGFKALYYKELSDYFRGARFWIILGLVAVVGAICVASAANAFQKLIDLNTENQTNSATQFMFLNLFILNGDNMISFGTLMAMFGPIVGLALGFDAINGERTRRTLSRLLAQPIYRDTVINAKFLAGVTMITLIVFALGFVISGAGMVLIGLVPALEELLRILVYLLFTVVYVSLFLAISLLLSLLFRHMVGSAMTGIGIWLLFVIFFSLIANGIANAIYPIPSTPTLDALMKNIGCSEAISRISPTTLYGEAASAILNPSLTSITSTFTVSQYYQSMSAISGNLPLGQSLLLVWPHLTGLVALTMICFAISYVCFMKQEVRAD